MTRRISSSRPMTGSSLPCRRDLGEVAAELLERLVLVLGVLVGDAVRAADGVERLEELVARRAGVDLRVVGQREQQVLGGDVLVAERARLLLGLADHLRGLEREAGLLVDVAGDGGLGVDGLVGAAADALGVGVRAAQDGRDDAAVLLEQGDEHVLRGDLRVAARDRDALRRGQGLLGLDGEAVWSHGRFSFWG